MQNRLPSVSAIGQHDEVRVVGIAIRVDPDSAQRYQAVRLRLLFGRAGDVYVEVDPRVVGAVLALSRTDHGSRSSHRRDGRGQPGNRSGRTDDELASFAL